MVSVASSAGGGVSLMLGLQPDQSHTVDLIIGDAYWPSMREFLWTKLRLAVLR